MAVFWLKTAENGKSGVILTGFTGFFGLGEGRAAVLTTNYSNYHEYEEGRGPSGESETLWATVSLRERPGFSILKIMKNPVNPVENGCFLAENGLKREIRGDFDRIYRIFRIGGRAGSRFDHKLLELSQRGGAATKRIGTQGNSQAGKQVPTSKRVGMGPQENRTG